MKTYMAKKEAMVHKWVHVDATDKVLGRLATRIAMTLMGKHRPTYTPHVETGDCVVVTNVNKIRVTGSKASQKVYKHFTGYPSGLREIPYKTMLEKKPEEILKMAVRRMLPKGALGNKMLSRLKMYVGSEHPHKAQMPADSAYLVGDKRG
jgi:large subunit ribosomal protein L13